MKNLVKSFSGTNSKLLLLLVFLGLGISSVNGQNKSITGTVTDPNGEPIPGVSVMIKGTSVGTATDFDGNFNVEASETDVLVFSSIGYTATEVTVSNQSTIDVQLAEDISSLDEVVVIGYGTQKKSSLSGAVGEVKAEEIAANPAPSLSNALVGQAAGVIAVQRSGEPGNDDSYITIRGIGTTGDAQPIYVIDGIVRSQRDFSQLNSNEIESFSILKDAASAAVFGVRGGNGVILVTTKRGASGKMQINFSTDYGIQERTNEPDYLNSYEFAQLYNEALVNEGQQILYSQDDLDKYRDHSSPDTHPDSDWLSVLDKTAPLQKYSLSANGGSEKVQYATSLSFLDQDGVIPSNNFKRYNFRSNIDAWVTNTTKMSFDLSGRDDRTNNVYDGQVFRWLGGTPPNKAPIKWSNGEYSSGPAYLTVPENGYRQRVIQAFKGRIQLEQQLPLDGLSIKGIAAYDKTFTDQKNWNFATVPYYNRLSDGTFEEAPRGATELYQDHNDYASLTLEAHLNYAQTFGKSNVTGLLLYTQTEDKWNFLMGLRDGYTLNVDELDFGDVANRNNRGYSGSSGRQGVVGRFTYSYDDKYIVEASFRADGSEQFASDKRWGFFPSASVAYVISNEAFLEDSSVIDVLKFRASYGVLGNDRIGGSRFLYLQSFFQGGNAVFGDGVVQPAIYEGNLANTDVTWETVKKLNIGIDATLWGGLLSGTFDYFYDDRSDILGQRNLSVPDLLGVGLPVENLAKVENKGFEFSLWHRNTVGSEFKYSLQANMTYAKNKVIFIDEPETENPNIRRTGLPLGAQFGYQALGLFQTQEEVDNAPTHSSNTAPGDIRYADINEDGVINDLDRTYIGTDNNPEIIFGMGGNMEYKNFEFIFLFQGATNVNQYYAGEAAWPFFVGGGAIKQNLDRWTPNNPNASEPRALINAGMNHAESSFWFKDASYIRLKNVELAYNVPVDNVKFFDGVRIYANANNAFTWSSIKNFDPENANGRGWDYPQFRIWNFGVNFRF